jgi:redox-sensitive bicupin YhaK (pirin superfamily)
VQVFSPMVYLDVLLMPSASFTVPNDYPECAVYSVTEGLSLKDKPLEAYRLAILQPNSQVTISATTNARCIVIGGEPLGMRYKWWNFVSSRIDRIEEAKADWRNGNFAQVPEVVSEANPF